MTHLIVGEVEKEMKKRILIVIEYKQGTFLMKMN